ncbi:MAG TPA: ABC transporter substrate-binding protein [Paucimonas sp.]|nr:ABC transporter substrate-binding protein [Paucimonas sp.]
MRLPLTARTVVRLIGACLACALAAPLAHAGSADPNKVIRPVFEANDDGFDMVRSNNNLYSTWVGQAIFETLLTYDYLARPVKLMPGTAEAMPEITDDGKTYLFRIKKGIHFTPDPAFKGKRRELTAADYAYSIKRILDPKNRSVQAPSFEGKIVGMDEAVAQAKKTDNFDYDAPIAGLEVVDRYTLRIRLTAPDPNFNYLLADVNTGAVAREVVEHYTSNLSHHPVGTGPYMLTKYMPQSKIILEANPDYRGFVWDFQSSGEAWDEQVIRDMKGKRMPQIGRVEISIIEEEQSRWLAFDSGQIDYDWIAPAAVPRVLDGGQLNASYRARGFQLYRFVNADLTYAYFNFKDPVVGGYTKDKIALRRAMIMSYLLDDEIQQVRHGQAVPAQQPVPPGIIGHDPNYRSGVPRSIDLANKLLDKFGYKKGADGWRTLPDGKPLLIKFATQASSLNQRLNEVWKRSFDRIGVKVDFAVSSFADNLKSATRCELMMWSLANNASIPDAVSFLEAYYGPNANQGNFGCYQSAVYDDLYRKIRLMPQSPERQALLRKMYRQLEVDGVQNLHVHRIRPWLLQPWVKGFKKHPVQNGDWMYLDIVKK